MNRLLRLICYEYKLENSFPESEEVFQLSADLSRIPHANQGTNSIRGSGGQNTVIRMQLSIRASTSFRVFSFFQFPFLHFYMTMQIKVSLTSIMLDFTLL